MVNSFFDKEALKVHREGGRVTGKHSMFTEERLDPKCAVHHWRTIACADQRDICECSKCGKQSEFECNFEEEYS